MPTPPPESPGMPEHESAPAEQAEGWYAEGAHAVPEGRRDTGWMRGAAIGAGLAALILLAGNLIRLDMVILSPGPAINTLGETQVEGKKVPLIQVSGRPSYPAKGTLQFTTVLMAGGPGKSVSGFEWLGAKIAGDEIYPTDVLYPNRPTAEQVKTENTVAMRGSQESASVVALRAVGEKVTPRLAVREVPEDSKAKNVLKSDDTLRKVHGTPVTTAAEVSKALERVKPGDSVDVDLVRDNKPMTLKVQTMTLPGTQRTGLNLTLSETYDFPTKITVSAGDVGGPSAGLMFSLGIYDTLTPGELTGGKRIAGTGTMSDDGKVGPIGGIAEKMRGAKDAEAEFFLSPADNCAEARGHIPDGLTVVKVGTFDDARQAVEKIGKGQTSGLPAC